MALASDLEETRIILVGAVHESVGERIERGRQGAGQR
jgi:hypothetical protein